jgi:hypothetical protein
MRNFLVGDGFLGLKMNNWLPSMLNNHPLQRALLEKENIGKGFAMQEVLSLVIVNNIAFEQCRGKGSPVL